MSRSDEEERGSREEDWMRRNRQDRALRREPQVEELADTTTGVLTTTPDWVMQMHFILLASAMECLAASSGLCFDGSSSRGTLWNVSAAATISILNPNRHYRMMQKLSSDVRTGGLSP